MTLDARLAALGMVAAAFAGCIAAQEEYYGFDADAQYRNPGVFPGNYTFGNQGSTVLVPGTLKPSEPEVIRLRSNLPAYPSPVGESTTDGEVFITMAVWRPLNTSGPVPVIVDAGPYFEVGVHCEVNYDPCPPGMVKNDTIDWPGQTTPFSLKNFLPHGYAVAQVAVRGTGTAGGCMDLMGPAEVHDLDQAITWLGEQEWSNGNVAMIGASYDGSTPWEVAGTGNPHLKAIVPVSGLPDIFDLMFHNGSAESRGLYMHSYVYWGYGFQDGWPYTHIPGGSPQWPREAPIPPPVQWPPMPPFPVPEGQANGRQGYQDLQNLLCPEVYEGIGAAGLASVLGTRGDQATSYWAERDHRQRILDNYNGSVFLIHGLQDWNVDPHAAIPFNEALRAKGLEVKEWYGQWDHAFPDSWCTPRTPTWVSMPCRLDYADVLLRYFDRHLKGNTTVDTGPMVQVESNVHVWRNLDAYPPTDTSWLELRPTGEGWLGNGSAASETTVTLNPPREGGPTEIIELATEPLPADLHISGLPQLKLPFSAKGSGGQVGAWLMDEDPHGNVRAPFAGRNPYTNRWEAAGIPIVGHAQMNLHYHAGGDEPDPVRPNERYVAQIEFEPLEVMVPAGHRLVLWVFQQTYPDHVATATPAPIDVYLGEESVLRLPVWEHDPTTIFPVPGVFPPDPDQQGRHYVPRPVFTPGVLPASQSPVCAGGPSGSGLAFVPADPLQARSASPGAPGGAACGSGVR